MVNKQEIGILKVSLRFLCLHQVWPKNEEIFDLGAAFYIRSSLLLLSTSWLMVSGMTHLFISLKDNINTELSENIGMVLSLFGVHYLSVVFVGRIKYLRTLYMELSDFSVFRKPPQMDATTKRYDIYSKLYYWYCTVGIAIYGFCNCILEKGECERINVERNLTEICGMYTATYMPFDINYFPVKQIVLSLQFYSAEMILRSSAIIAFTALECTQIVVAKFQYLEVQLMQTFQTTDIIQQKKMFISCIQYHNHIIRQANMVSDTYTVMHFVHMLVTGIVLGSIAHQVVTIFTIGALIHLSAWLMGLYVVCFGGEVLYNASLHIPTALYTTKWYEAPVDMQKDLLLIILRAQKPLHLKAGPIGYLKFDLFVTIMKTSYSYLTLLNNLSK